MMHWRVRCCIHYPGASNGDWKTGQTMPFSANFDTKLWFDRAFMQKSVRLDMNRLEAQCARWLGYPLVERLRFDLRPFSDQLEQNLAAGAGLRLVKARPAGCRSPAPRRSHWTNTC